jgi:hypothetical protein
LFSLPTTLSVVPEGDKAPELISELRGSGFAQEKLPASASPFLDEATKNLLAQSRGKVLIIGGLATEAVVLHAVLDACAQGYEVLVPVDVCGGMSETGPTILRFVRQRSRFMPRHSLICGTGTRPNSRRTSTGSRNTWRHFGLHPSSGSGEHCPASKL